jgi:hypothetical protein
MPTPVSGGTSREFTDGVGARWTVRYVEPMPMSPTFDRIREQHARAAGRPSPERRVPWLVFESRDGETRRLAPAPDGWATCSDFELGRWCMRAVKAPPAPARRTEDR